MIVSGVIRDRAWCEPHHFNPPQYLCSRFRFRFLRFSGDANPFQVTPVILSGDTKPCRMTGVTLYGVVSPEFRGSGFRGWSLQFRWLYEIMPGTSPIASIRPKICFRVSGFAFRVSVLGTLGSCIRFCPDLGPDTIPHNSRFGSNHSQLAAGSGSIPLGR